MNKSLINLAVALFLLAPAIAFSAGNAAAGKTKSVMCHACHGETGKSLQPIYPNLGGQHADYLEYALRGYRDGSRRNAIMSRFAATLSDTDIEDIAAWYASQPGLTEIKHK